jgi:Zn-dependent M28 family amino/carboxypeptidase
LGTGLQITETCTDRSDHASFWKHGIPAVVISENFFGGDDNPCYHRACDKMDIMNLSYYQKVAEASAGVVGSIVLGH